MLLRPPAKFRNIFPHEFMDCENFTGSNACNEGNVTVSTDADGSSLQLVEMCSNGVWSPLCDNDWTPQDVTVVCRELGYSSAGIQQQAILNTLHFWHQL